MSLDWLNDMLNQFLECSFRSPNCSVCPSLGVKKMNLPSSTIWPQSKRLVFRFCGKAECEAKSLPLREYLSATQIGYLPLPREWIGLQLWVPRRRGGQTLSYPCKQGMHCLDLVSAPGQVSLVLTFGDLKSAGRLPLLCMKSVPLNKLKQMNPPQVALLELPSIRSLLQDQTVALLTERKSPLLDLLGVQSCTPACTGRTLRHFDDDGFERLNDSLYDSANASTSESGCEDGCESASDLQESTKRPPTKWEPKIRERTKRLISRHRSKSSSSDPSAVAIPFDNKENKNSRKSLRTRRREARHLHGRPDPY